jgi:hypothetical protein
LYGSQFTGGGGATKLVFCIIIGHVAMGFISEGGSIFNVCPKNATMYA